MLMSFVTVSAQQEMSEEERAKAINERIEKAAERMAKDFELKGDKKETFVATYVAFQKEMFATNASQAQRPAQQAEEKKSDELTDEEATAKIQETLERQEQQIATMQKRLEVQKQYSEKFAEVLTPQQILKVIAPQRGQRQRGQNGDSANGGGNRQRGGFGGPGGGFGGPGGGFGGPGF